MSSETRPSELLKLARAVRERRRADVYDAGAGLAAGGAGSVVFGRGMRKENLRAARNIGRLRSQISDAIKAQKAMPGALDEAERLTAATEAALKRPLQSVPDNVLDAADRFKKKGPTPGTDGPAGCRRHSEAAEQRQGRASGSVEADSGAH
jgi:hypothetical protein